MEMEIERESSVARARLRIQQLSNHLTGGRCHATSAAAALSLMRCTGISKQVFKRYDNMLLFARQGNESQGYFMRQVTVDEHPEHAKENTYTFSYPATANQGPMFSRPFEVTQNASIPSEIAQRDIQSAIARTPLFAKPSSCRERDHIQFTENKLRKSMDEWHPRMDAAESGDAYVFTIELPGVTASSIRVEVDGKRLLVVGKRSTQWWRNDNKNGIVYHKQELADGPYRIVCNIPDNTNIDVACAEFVDGFLQITIPKQGY